MKSTDGTNTILPIDRAPAQSSEHGAIADDRPISTKEMSALLTQEGLPTAAATLTKLRCVGGGPSYLKYGRTVLYRPSVVRAWAAAKTEERLHTSQVKFTEPSTIHKDDGRAGFSGKNSRNSRQS